MIFLLSFYVFSFFCCFIYLKCSYKFFILTYFPFTLMLCWLYGTLKLSIEILNTIILNEWININLHLRYLILKCNRPIDTDQKSILREQFSKTVKAHQQASEVLHVMKCCRHLSVNSLCVCFKMSCRCNKMTKISKVIFSTSFFWSFSTSSLCSLFFVPGRTN